GLDVYRFVQTIEPTAVAVVEVPGLMFDQPGVVEAERVYANVRTLWVEPHTGAIIDAQEETDSYLEFDGTRGPTLIQGTLTYTDDHVAANIDEHSGAAERLQLVRTTGPLTSAVVGGVLVTVGFLLGRRRYVGRKASKDV